MLELKNISINLKKDGRQITDNFSFTLKSGDKAVIIGEEGNGKSTLLKFIYDRRLVENYCDCGGSIITKSKIAYLPQMMEEKHYQKPLADFFGDTDYYLHTDILARLELTLDFILSEQKMSTLSGGEKVKVQLARLLMDESDILLLDEPTNDLDISTLRFLETFISESKQPILFISHDETLIENTANVIVHMEQLIRKTKCRISVARCPYREYLSHRQDIFSHQEQVAQNQRCEYYKQMEKWQQIYNRVDHEQRNISKADRDHAGQMMKKKMSTILSMGKRFEREKENFLDFPQEEDAILGKFDENISLPPGKTILDFYLDSLSIGERCLAQNIRLHVTGNEHIGITGRNGAGKSTLLGFIWETLKDRKDIVTAFMPQDYEDVLDFSKTPIEYLAENYTKDEVTKARTYMGSMKLIQEEMMGIIGNLSGGQKAKLLYLDMVLKKANVLLLDEPTRNFSPLSVPVVRTALANFGGAIISVSHDRKYLCEVCDKIYELTESGLQQVNNKEKYL